MQRDYVMRLIEQVAALIASMVCKVRSGQYLEARAELNEKAQQNVGLTLDEARKFSPEAVKELLGSAGGLRYGRAVMLAELLLLDAEISEATGHPSDALLNYLHAFCLLCDSVDGLPLDDQAVYLEKLDKLAARLTTLPDHPYLSEKLAGYHARQR